MTDAKLRQESVDRANLDAAAAALVSQLRGIDVVAAVGHRQWQRGTSIHNLLAMPRAGEPLQEFLQN